MLRQDVVKLFHLQSYANRYDVHTLKLLYPKQNKLTVTKKLIIEGKHKSELEIIPLDITNELDTLATLNDRFQ